MCLRQQQLVHGHCRYGKTLLSRSGVFIIKKTTFLPSPRNHSGVCSCHTNLKTVLPVDSRTRKGKTLDQVYTNIPGAYKARPSPHPGYSDDLSLSLTPAYKPIICRSKPQHKTMQSWTEEAKLSLHDCFENTTWKLFEEPGIELHTSSVL